VINKKYYTINVLKILVFEIHSTIKWSNHGHLIATHRIDVKENQLKTKGFL